MRLLEKESQEMLLKMIKQAKESEKEAMALKECTFTPNLKLEAKQRTPTRTTYRRLDQSIYDRNLEWELYRQHKLEDERALLNKIPEDCTFRPNINSFRPAKLSNYPKELSKSPYMKDALACHYYRMDRARSKSPPKGLPSKDISMISREPSTSRCIDRESMEKIHKVRRSMADGPRKRGFTFQEASRSVSKSREKRRKDRHDLEAPGRRVHEQLMSLDLDGYETPHY